MHSLFLNEFSHHGLDGKVIDQDVIQIFNDNAAGIAGMRHSSIFCDKICERVYPAKYLLSLNTLPVPRGIACKAGELQRGLSHVKHINFPCLLTGINSPANTTHIINNKKELKAMWGKEKSKGTKYLLLEETIAGHHVYVAIVAGKYRGALLLEPVTVTGDGSSSIEQLIEHKNKLRSQNPWYQDKLISINEEVLATLHELNLKPDSVPHAGQAVILEKKYHWQWGGETVNIADYIHQDFIQHALQSVAVVPGLELAVVQMVIPYPEHPANRQKWVVSKIDVRAPWAMFHFPWKGKQAAVVHNIVNELCLTNRTKWIKGD